MSNRSFDRALVANVEEAAVGKEEVRGKNKGCLGSRVWWACGCVMWESGKGVVSVVVDVGIRAYGSGNAAGV